MYTRMYAPPGRLRIGALFMMHVSILLARVEGFRDGHVMSPPPCERTVDTVFSVTHDSICRYDEVGNVGMILPPTSLSRI